MGGWLRRRGGGRGGGAPDSIRTKPEPPEPELESIESVLALRSRLICDSTLPTGFN